ncbi:hypothetical protein [Amnibacterium sp.]|uniref:hypothetical protein n=1 Tax=Amnibacterium sp. TaxID=1872496 RepID=UPI0026076D12|nr:hypothetical protein [Amnibacterium sp.]MCU1474252.1 hypothetical protein [Amnibacterium sp.]
MARDGSAAAERAVDEFEARLAASAFGAATRASFRLESSQEDALFSAATNLLEKAAKRLAAGDADGAAALVRRALALDHGADDQTPPGPVAASTLLIGELVERADRASAAASGDWLGPLLALHRDADGPLAAEVARALDTLAELGLEPAEVRRIRAVARPGARLEEPLGEVRDPVERVQVVLALLRLVIGLRVFGSAG